MKKVTRYGKILIATAVISSVSVGELPCPKGRSFLRTPANARYLGGFKDNSCPKF